MSEPLIAVENLGKKYRIRHLEPGRQNNTFRGAISGEVRALGRRLRGDKTLAPTVEDFWAVRDVSFTVERGQAVAIIGRNGAGKSTLLKLLSRITEPTVGRIVLRGRVASLLEVGTGFHPELTGRENVFLNGAILGMKRQQIASKFDEIVSFAEVEKFVDTQVKHFSSGMYMRLAFSVAAHLEPEILVVDEVLAVGDMAFQKKCLGRMEAVAHEGRTVLFVSHNMAAVHSLCTRAIVLDRGSVDMQGSVGEAIHRYNALLRTRTAVEGAAARGVQARNVRIESPHEVLTPESPVTVEMDLVTDRPLEKCYLNFLIDDHEGRAVVHARTDVVDLWPRFDAGVHRVRIELPRLGMRAGVYSVWFRVYAANSANDIADSEVMPLEVTGPAVGGIVASPYRWSWSHADSEALSGESALTPASKAG